MENLTYDEKLDLFNAMEMMGGSFATALAKAWHHADMFNQKKIEETWTEMIMDYQRFVKKEEKNG